MQPRRVSTDLLLSLQRSLENSEDGAGQNEALEHEIHRGETFDILLDLSRPFRTIGTRKCVLEYPGTRVPRYSTWRHTWSTAKRAPSPAGGARSWVGEGRERTFRRVHTDWRSLAKHCRGKLAPAIANGTTTILGGGV